MKNSENKKACKACLQEIPKKATKCSHCGQKQSLSNCCAIPLLVFLVLFFVGTLGIALDESGSNRSSSSVSQTEASDLDAYLISKHFVEATLKSPSTVEWPSTMFDEPYTVNKEGDLYTVTSYVDAQNSFGALVRTYYTIKLRYLGGDPLDIANWEYIEMQTE